MHCGSGTYVRALARDLGARLGCGAHLTSLRRTAVGMFSVEQAVTLADLESGTGWMQRRLDPAAAVCHLARVTITEEEERELGFGRPIEPTGPARAIPTADEPVAAVRDGRLLAIGNWIDGRYRPKKVFTR